MNKKILNSISDPADLRRLNINDLPDLCDEIRDYIIDTLSNTGGHFASNLGVVELTVALHYVLNTPIDRLIWDVGHQTYSHKILTGRKEMLKSVRIKGGISGFPKREESEYDTYNTGHAGTSIAQLLGEAIARDKKGERHRCAAVIGDASIATGMAFESLNHGGHLQSDCVVILNDNDMSISHNVGALNQYLNRLITSTVYNKWRRFWYRLLFMLPVIGPMLQIFSKKIEKSTKDFFLPGNLFHDFGFRYIGPVDGHDVKELIYVLDKVFRMKGPILVHVFTNKGKGYTHAENNPTLYHSVSHFNRRDGYFSPSRSDRISFSDVVGKTLIDLAEKNERLLAITPAMIEGSGLHEFAQRFPDRIYDVGIAEQHAVAFSGALASSGMVPFLCIYSTFLIRGIDQLIEDVCLMNLPARIVIDRAGCVGPDGETHQGLFDMGMMLGIPNLRIYAPATGIELRAMLHFMERDSSGPIAVRFPKEDCDLSVMSEELPDLSAPKPVVSGSGTSIALICTGTMWQTGLQIERELRRRYGICSTVIGLRWIRPLDFDELNRLLDPVKTFVIIDESYIHSGAASYLLSSIRTDILSKHLKTYAFPQISIPHGGRREILKQFGLDGESIIKDIMERADFGKNFMSPLVQTSEIR
jgi:1-deoxy-D-xylulose-5-phosphate synthase